MDVYQSTFSFKLQPDSEGVLLVLKDPHEHYFGKCSIHGVACWLGAWAFVFRVWSVFYLWTAFFSSPAQRQSQIMGVLCTNYHNFLGTFLHWRQGCHLSSNASSFLMLCLRCHVQCHIWLLRPLPCMIGQQWAFWMGLKL